jgi:hypothetical protein
LREALCSKYELAREEMTHPDEETPVQKDYMPMILPDDLKI